MPPEECPGVHVAPALDVHVTIEWSQPLSRSTSFRVRCHTCDCVPTTYELCAAAGLAHIRRTEKLPGGGRISESPWLRSAETYDLWQSLLAGRAR